MRQATWWVAGWVVGLASTFASMPLVAIAQEFRVDTEIFQNQEKEPILQQLTIFRADGTVYDFRLIEPLETTVFDPRHGRFTLLDESRKAKATVTTQDLFTFSMNVAALATKKGGSAFLAFCAEPKFETTEKPLEKNGQSLVELTLAGKPMTYVAEGLKPTQLGAAKAYRQFTDWCARLNATHPGNHPAGARLALNQALGERELLPLEITLTMPPALPLGKKTEYKSQHRFNWALAGEDHKRIERASDMIATFQAISYDEYCGVAIKSASAKQARK